MWIIPGRWSQSLSAWLVIPVTVLDCVWRGHSDQKSSPATVRGKWEAGSCLTARLQAATYAMLTVRQNCTPKQKPGCWSLCYALVLFGRVALRPGRVARQQPTAQPSRAALPERGADSGALKDLPSAHSGCTRLSGAEQSSTCTNPRSSGAEGRRTKICTLSALGHLLKIFLGNSRAWWWFPSCC